MSAPKTPSIDAQIEALSIAFVELAKFLGRQQVISVLQFPGVLESEAKAAKASEETLAAVAELVRKLRA